MATTRPPSSAIRITAQMVMFGSNCALMKIFNITMVPAEEKNENKPAKCVNPDIRYVIRTMFFFQIRKLPGSFTMTQFQSWKVKLSLFCIQSTIAITYSTTSKLHEFQEDLTFCKSRQSVQEMVEGLKILCKTH